MKRFLWSLSILTIVFCVLAKFKMNATKTNFLNDEIKELMSYVEKGEALDTVVSKAKVSWHIAHSLKTINEISKALKASNPDEYDHSFSGLRTMSLTFNYIPRGRAQSPESVRPPENFTNEFIESEYQLTLDNLKEIIKLDENAHFDHPYFGLLYRPHAFRFMEVHTRHHLKIIKDIIKK